MRPLLVCAAIVLGMAVVGWLASIYGPRVSDLILRRVVVEVAP